MEMTALVWERKQLLQQEIEDIKIAIKALESNSLCEFNMESKKEVLDTDTLMYTLMMTENINNMEYTKVELTSSEENLFEYEADATTGPVQYHLQFKLKFASEGTKPSVSDLKITVYNQFMETELKPWQNKCIRENSLQTFQRGIVSYGELFIIREKIFVFLQENASDYFLLERCVEEGKYIISAINKETDLQYFWCSWELSWNSATSSMMNFFSVHANNRVPFSEENKDLFAELTNSPSNLTSQRVEEIWKTLAENVIEAIQAS